MAKHTMNLNNKPFNSIKNGTKKIELRLYDEKRQALKENDFIEFNNRETSEKILTKIEKIYKYPSFKELYKNIDKKLLGYLDDEIASYKDMELYYSQEEQQKYGVVGIQIKVINDEK